MLIKTPLPLSRLASFAVLLALSPTAAHAANFGLPIPTPQTTPVPTRTFYVDKNNKGGPCNDNNTVTQAQSITTPWCTLKKAARNVEPGDLVYVRGGASAYNEIDSTWVGNRKDGPGITGASSAVLDLYKHGSASKPIVYKAYPGDSPVATIDPTGAADPVGGTGLLFGVRALGPIMGACAGGNNAGMNCLVDGDCPGSSCDVSKNDFYTWIDGIRFQNWSFYDTRENATESSHNDSRYAAFVINGGWGTPRFLTFHGCEFLNNNGGGVLHIRQSAGVTVEYCSIHDNFTHGWTTALNFYLDQGKAAGAMSVARGNTVFNNQEDPPIWCLPKFCAGKNSACVSSGNPYPCCTGSKSGTCDLTTANRCWYDLYTNNNATPTGSETTQGYGCGCNVASQCASGVCQTHGGGCAGDTEGHGIIVDVGGSSSGVLIENNIFYNNEGEGINIFRSDNVLVRNNVSWKNNIRPSNAEAAIFANRTSVLGNIIVPRTGHRGLGMYYSTSVYPIDQTTNREDYNLVWSPDRSDVFEWGPGNSGTLSAYQSGNGQGWGAHSTNSNPLVVDGDGAHNFHLQGGSPALNAGSAADQAPRDHDATLRGSADIGAFAGVGGIAPPVLLSVDPVAP
jgi:parallel beta-helix repeat protein